MIKVPRKKFDAIEYLFQNLHFISKFLEANPQCEGCGEVDAIGFGEIEYKGYCSKHICPMCKNFKGVYEFKGLAPLEEHLKNL